MAADHGFFVRLSEAVGAITDGVGIEAAAFRVLGARLNVSGAFYGETASHEQRLRDFGAQAMVTWRAGRPFMITDARTEPHLDDAERATYAAADTRALLGVPIVEDGQLAAVLGVRTGAPRAWTADDVAIVEDAAGRAWATVEHARMAAALLESEATCRALRDLGGARQPAMVDDAPRPRANRRQSTR